MKKNIYLIIQGFLIGLGKIIPGVSGAMLAISMGLYEKGIKSLRTFWKKESFFFLCKCGIGFLLALIFGSKVIMSIYHKYYFYTISFFVGIIFCSVLEMKKKVRFKNKNILISFFICFIFSLFLTSPNEKMYIFDFSYKDYFFLILVGFIEAFSMMFPGVSGTSLMMMMGVYTFLMTTLSNLFQFEHFLYHISIFFPFLIGIFIGIFVFTRILDKLFRFYPKQMNYMIFGFVLSSILFLANKLIFYHPTIYEVFTGLFFFILGVILAYFTGD